MFDRISMSHFSLDEITVIQLRGIWHLRVRFIALRGKANFNPALESNMLE